MIQFKEKSHQRQSEATVQRSQTDLLNLLPNLRISSKKPGESREAASQPVKGPHHGREDARSHPGSADLLW